MAVRNFYIDVNIDGRRTPLHGGPQGKGGGMSINIYQRDQGCVKKAYIINCYETQGELRTMVHRCCRTTDDTELVDRFFTERD